ncbi:PEP-CTERM sorting domain-containing protein [Vibrio ulleungensis]|uniref:PEP-CTERM sorting domain-containing protein n=1 Tax=Vibrio ulleungensis TaxID=2807619 RepID=A0ABS2HQT4_9VIBR|nr:PEP-CTERM sorting domain-containing protein [Vibrio ulleungensis]MBM7038573.1 PEP-CTERM sorting domain-containing protein [Vibrio ulleungensis]
MLKTTLITALGCMFIAGQAQAITFQFDWNGGAYDYVVPDGGHAANGTDYSGTTLKYGYGAGQFLTIGSSTEDTVQDIRPVDAGIGADGGVNGDNTGIGEWLSLAFSSDVTVTAISFNGGNLNSDGHDDYWNGDNNIRFDLLNGAILEDTLTHNFKDSPDGALDGLTGDILSTDLAKITSVDTRFYLESITFEESEIEITTFGIPVPEPETLVLFSLGLIGLGASLRHRRRTSYS